MECDIYYCFEELDPPYVINALKRLFKDQETLWLCDAMMEYGVLIGAFFSAWFLHLTLQPLDLMIHDKKYGVSHYLRQMDNFTIFGPNKRKLRKLLEAIKLWLASVGLKLKCRRLQLLYPGAAGALCGSGRSARRPAKPRRKTCRRNGDKAPSASGVKRSSRCVFLGNTPAAC